MKSQDVKKEILDGIFRSKDGLSSNELTELLNTLIEVAKIEGRQIDILKSTPCIQAKAYFQYETFTDIRVNNSELPEKFRLKDIQILIP